MEATEMLSDHVNITTPSSNNLEVNETKSTVPLGRGSDYYVIDASLMDILLKVTTCGIMPPMCTFGIIANILALIILIRHKPTRSTTVLLIAIAFADLAFIVSTIVNVSTLIIRAFYPEKSKDISVTFLTPFSVYLSPLPGRISNWLVTFISLERLVAVTLPLKVKQICTKKLMRTLVIVIPVAIGILTGPKLWLYEVKDVTLPDGNVTKIIALGAIGRQKQLFEVYYVVSEIVLRFVPMGLCIICNIIIIAVTCIQAKWRKKKQKYTIGKQSQRDQRQITKTLLTITCIFVICLLPSTVSRLMILFDPNSSHVNYSSNIHTLFTLIGLITETFNSSINFVIYITMSQAYRRQLFLLFGRKTFQRDKTLSCSGTTSSTNDSTGDNNTTEISVTDDSGDGHM